jgi:hypothetical protein
MEHADARAGEGRDVAKLTILRRVREQRCRHDVLAGALLNVRVFLERWVGKVGAVNVEIG